MKNSKKYYSEISSLIDSDLAKAVSIEFPPNLYNPMKYVLSSKGKRFRPVLLIMACETVGGSFQDAYNASLAIEILHNFTLVHDDIMDDDQLRRGRKTVHKKWNNSIAILTGDGLIALAYRYLLRSKTERIRDIIKKFSEAIIKICEGQSLDKDMESASEVNIDDYLDMIKRKTGVLISISAELGGILGNASETEIEALKNFGFEIGIAFQIQDDLLDIISDEVVIGKDLGSDLALGKKTYPIIKLLECVPQTGLNFLKDVLENGNTGVNSIRRVKTMLHEYGIVDQTQSEISRHIDKAVACLNDNLASLQLDHLMYMSEMIRNRKF
ncbi:polyprenyl synthetase family protein [candidate division KSB1 bacterium]|nr:polyprenyl synthetase family protein [candidate division KSB1 bacterium]